MSLASRRLLVTGFFAAASLVAVQGAAAQGTAKASADPVRLMVAPQGNTARYRVREQLAGFDLPNDAVGETTDIKGALVLDAKGAFAAGSRIEVNVTGLKSDKDRRDNYLRMRTLETAAHPAVTLVPTAMKGIAFPLPASGKHAVELTADLTIKGVTRPTVWRGEATIVNGSITGTVATSFKFEEFGLTKPSVRSVLSVDDDIKLEYDFMFVPATN